MSTVEEPIESDQLRELRQQLAAQAQIIAANERQLAAKVETISANETELAQVKRQLDERQEHIAWLTERLELLQSKRYQHSSEKFSALQGQLFDESELDVEINDVLQ